jgi:basic membrane protein A
VIKNRADLPGFSLAHNPRVSVLYAFKAIFDNTFTGGDHIGTLENGGVSLAPFYNLDVLVSSSVKAELEQIKADIIAGKIKTNPEN